MALRATKGDEDARCGRTLGRSWSCAVAGRGVFAVSSLCLQLSGVLEDVTAFAKWCTKSLTCPQRDTVYRPRHAAGPRSAETRNYRTNPISPRTQRNQTRCLLPSRTQIPPGLEPNPSTPRFSTQTSRQAEQEITKRTQFRRELEETKSVSFFRHEPKSRPVSNPTLNTLRQHSDIPACTIRNYRTNPISPRTRRNQTRFLISPRTQIRPPTNPNHAARPTMIKWSDQSTWNAPASSCGV